MGWQLLICLCCVLYVVHLTAATLDWSSRDDRDADQVSDDVDTAAWLTSRRARRRQRISQLDGASLTPHIRLRRRKKLDDMTRRGRGEGGVRTARRRGFHETTTTSTVHQDSWTPTTSAQPITGYAVDLVTPSSEVTEVTRVAGGRVSDVMVHETMSDNDDAMMILLPSNGTVMTSADVNQRAVNACRIMRCPRYRVCLLNIQGLPMCRCPSVYHCRGLERRPVCTVDGRSYRNKCFLRVDECASNRRLRVQHRGACRSGPGRRSFDVGGPSSQRRHRPRQRQLELTADEVAVRRRARRRRPRHNPVTG